MWGCAQVIMTFVRVPVGLKGKGYETFNLRARVRVPPGTPRTTRRLTRREIKRGSANHWED